MSCALAVADVEKLHIRMPHRRAGSADGKTINGFHHLEHARQDLVFREILLHFLIGKSIALNAQFFAGIGDVPCLDLVHGHFLACELAQLGQIALGVGPGACAQLIEKIHYLLRRLRHLGGQRFFGVALEAQQLRGLAPQLENLGDQRSIVQLGLAEFGSAGDVGGVHLFAQFAVLAVLQDGEIGRHVQGEFPACLAIHFGGLTRHLQCIGGNARQFGFVLDKEGKRIGGVEQVFLEFGGESGEFFLNGLETGLFLCRQIGAAEDEVAQLVFHDLFLRRSQRRKYRRSLERLEFVEQALVLRQVGIKGGEVGQVGVVDLAQFRPVGHGVEVGNLAPGTRKLLVGIFHRAHEIFPFWRCGVGYQLLYQRAVTGDQLFHRRGDMRRLDIGKARQAGEIEQRIGHVV